MNDCHKVGRNPIGHVWFCSIHDKPWDACRADALSRRVEELETYLAHEKSCRHCAEGGCEYCGECPEFLAKKATPTEEK